MSDAARLSADLSRVCEFLIRGDQNLASKFIKRDIDRYSDLKIEVGGKKLGDILEEIGKLDERAAERALTTSVILQRC